MGNKCYMCKSRKKNFENLESPQINKESKNENNNNEDKQTQQNQQLQQQIDQKKEQQIEEAINNNKYSDQYKENAFIDKIQKFAKVIGQKLLEPVLILFFAMKDENTPLQSKLQIISAIGYFICPLDVIPDCIPLVGFTDDYQAIIFVLGMVTKSIKEEHKTKAKEKLQEYLKINK